MTTTPSPTRRKVTLIPGDGIGPEVTRAAQDVLDAAGAQIEWEIREAGAKVFAAGLASGVPPETIASIRENGVALKGPLETPIGHGGKSANVTLRKLFETFANVRHVREFPGVPTPYAGRGIDLVVVRENVEDLYAGIEHMQTPSVAQSLKIASRSGCEKIVRLAFEVARAERRRSVHCATKANIMKLSEGMLKRAFEAVAPEYPELEARHIIVDNCAHQLVRAPEQFEVIVTSNMNGDILSDLTSGLVGGLGFAPGANLGNGACIFEAVHGSAPLHAGKDTANPVAVILSAVGMLRHLGELERAQEVEAAVLYTLERGVHTRDVGGEGAPVGTRRFTAEVIRNLGERPEGAPVRDHVALRIPPPPPPAPPVPRRTVGADVFVESSLPPERLGPAIAALADGVPLRLKMISNRGVQVWPSTGGTTECVDHFRCRFVLRATGAALLDRDLRALLERVEGHFRWMHVEKLEELSGAPGFTLAQGED